MWDENDQFGRWVQLICGVLLALLCIGAAWFSFGNDYQTNRLCDGVALTAGYVAYRCLRYALTGRDNINRDDF